MSPVLPPRRPLVLKASRDTLMLLVAAGAMTLAIAYSVHNRPALQSPVAEQTAVGQWAGQLADLTPQQTTSSAQAEPLSSDALTLPKAAMALPAAPKTGLTPRSRGCDREPCSPNARPAVANATAVSSHRSSAPAKMREASLIEKLNPLTHLPAAVTRPFASAGDAIAGWVKRF